MYVDMCVYVHAPVEVKVSWPSFGMLKEWMLSTLSFETCAGTGLAPIFLCWLAKVPQEIWLYLMWCNWSHILLYCCFSLCSVDIQMSKIQCFELSFLISIINIQEKFYHSGYCHIEGLQKQKNKSRLSSSALLPFSSFL